MLKSLSGAAAPAGGSGARPLPSRPGDTQAGRPGVRLGGPTVNWERWALPATHLMGRCALQGARLVQAAVCGAAQAGAAGRGAHRDSNRIPLNSSQLPLGPLHAQLRRAPTEACSPCAATQGPHVRTIKAARGPGPAPCASPDPSGRVFLCAGVALGRLRPECLALVVSRAARCCLGLPGAQQTEPPDVRLPKGDTAGRGGAPAARAARGPRTPKTRRPRCPRCLPFTTGSPGAPCGWRGAPPRQPRGSAAFPLL